MTPRSALPHLVPQQWELLPMRFHVLDSDRVVVTNMVGEHLIMNRTEFISLIDDQEGRPEVVEAMSARHLLRMRGDTLPIELLAMKFATRHRRLVEFTALHIFVVTLRCEHTCRYCQVSRRSVAKAEFDMTEETAEAALRLVFRSPSRKLKIEFQGGEPLLNFELIRWVVERADEMNMTAKRDLAFVIATNLALIDDDVLDFCAAHDIAISTSLDGPKDLHNANRRRPGQDSWERTVTGIERVRKRLGAERLSAVMTTTDASLDHPEEIIDSYVEIGLESIFLRPISPYGFAVRSRGGGSYGVERWLEFYRRGLQHIIDLNRRGVRMTEMYAAIVSRKILSNDDPGYLDLRSPAGMGIGCLVYNYDGAVYASDEGRMLAEMGDDTFLLGSVSDPYRQLLFSDKLLGPLTDSYTLSAPGCDLCAFEPWCGSDPVYHYATTGDFVGHKTFSAFCQRNIGIFSTLLGLLDDEYSRTVLVRWAHQ